MGQTGSFHHLRIDAERLRFRLLRLNNPLS
jgi:hypothetical protein